MYPIYYTLPISGFRAIVWLCQQGKAKQVYNIVDDGNTKQGDINNIVSDIFNINHDYWGNTLSTIAKVSLNSKEFLGITLTNP